MIQSVHKKKCLYKGVIVPTALYGAEAWGMRSAEWGKVTVLEKFVGSITIYRVKNEEVRRELE